MALKLSEQVVPWNLARGTIVPSNILLGQCPCTNIRVNNKTNDNSVALVICTETKIAVSFSFLYLFNTTFNIRY